MVPYRAGQGIYARAGAGIAALLVALFASVRLYQVMVARTSAGFQVLKVPVRYAALWGGGLFALLAAVAFVFIVGVPTGIKALDRTTHTLIDLLIETESELNKVSWPSSNELNMSTTAVLVCIVLLVVFLFCMDLFIGFFMSGLRVLPR